jgi:hypothetical protein
MTCIDMQIPQARRCWYHRNFHTVYQLDLHGVGVVGTVKLGTVTDGTVIPEVKLLPEPAPKQVPLTSVPQMHCPARQHGVPKPALLGL